MPMPEEMGHFRRAVEKRRFGVITRLIPRGGVHRVLDVGCGSGWLSEMLAGRGFTVTALDIGADSLKRASRRMEERKRRVFFVLGDVYRLPFADSGFDAVVASEVLEHLERPSDALTELVRVLRPGGWVVVSTPYRERIETVLCIHCNRKTPVNAHLHSFDESDIEAMLHGAGCDVERHITFVNRPLERLGFAGLSHFLPHVLWRACDAAACRLAGRQSFLAVRGVKRRCVP